MQKSSVASTAAALALAAISAAVISANAQAATKINLPAQPMSAAIQALARQTNTNILVDPRAVADRQSPALNEQLTVEEALARILTGTGLTAKYVDERTITLVAPPTDRSPSDSAATSTNDTAATSANDGASTASTPGAPASTPASRASPTSPATSRTLKGDQKPSFWDRFRLAQTNPAVSERASSNSTATDTDATGKVEEIVVTAQKRLERLQDVPISMAVIGGEDIERRGLIGMEDYLRSIPGVNQIDNGPISNAIIIRGITTSPQFENLGSGTTVASYFDETPITAAGGLGQGGVDVRPVDLERIEVLRGPQGTAYGSSSLGGTLRLIPARPNLSGFRASATGSYAKTGGLGGTDTMLQGVVNIPVVDDKLALRAVGYRFNESGFYRNVAGNDPTSIALANSFGFGGAVQGYVQDDVGRTVTNGGRLSALWKPADKVDVLVNVLTQKIEQDGGPITTRGTFDQTTLPIAPIGRIRGEAGEVADTDIDLANFVLNYDIGWGTFTTAVSKVKAESRFAVDITRTFPVPASQSGVGDFDSLTGEVRLASRLEGPFQFLWGVYYEDVDNTYRQTIDWPGPDTTNPFGTNPTLVVDLSRPVEQRATFAELSYDLTSKLTATVGGRYFSYDKGDSTLLEGGLVATPFGTGAAAELSSKESHSSYKANLSFKPTQDALFYATWAQGFRLGRPDPGAIAATCDLNADGFIDDTSISLASTRTINSDVLDNYEIGAKATLFDQRLSLDAAVYHIRWHGLPVRTFTTSTCGYTANAGEATSDGIELQAQIAVAKGVRVDVGAGYTRAELAEDAPAQGWNKDDRLPGSPKVSANLAAQYEFNLAGRAAFARVDSFYLGKFFSDFLESPGMDAGDYVKVDARAGVKFDNLGVELFVRNLTNEDAYTWRDPFRVSRLRPRTVGMQLAYTFE